MEIPVAGIPRLPGAGSSARGQSAPKARPKGVADGRQVNIPALAHRVHARRRRRTVAGVNGYPLYGRERPDRALGSPGARPCVHASQKSVTIPKRRPYQNRHRWEGTNIPRRAGETSLRNSATWPRNFGRRGPSGQCLEAQRNGPCDCLTKTQHCANPQGDVYIVTRDQCGKVKARSQPQGEAPNQSPRECRP